MRSLAAEKQVEHPELIVNRYRVEGSLGRGGMAVVYKVHDSSTDRHLALKQLIARDEGESQKRNLKLFEREFQTLCHLAHPRVVGVYDYGLDDHGPFYTMELLDGGDLRALSPMDWKEACRLMLDVCSVLSLLHSRRLVHRDLSHRNVRCTSDGLAKVIDFGAMVPVGPCRHAVGTPAFVAPEVLNLQSLDGRADLYSLGATLYYTLTGRQAYPARNFEQVRERWRMKPPAPSELVPGIPQALDRLVISLLSIDLAARPANAAEVMERLSAIADLNIDEQLVVSHAYLSAPDLVGREWALMRLRKKLRRARRGRGNTLIVRGASGVGRSRFIDACVLRGKLTGATVVRADAADARAGDWGVVRALAKQLLQAAPEEAFEAAKPRVGILGHILPELLDAYEGASLQSFDRGVDLRARLQVELREWFFQVSRQRYLLVAVDDIHRIDEPSAAFIAFLSHAAAEHPLVVCVSAETNAPTSCEGALKLLSDVGTKLGLKNLNVEQIEQLLGSVFGRVPNLQLVAHRIHAISQGNPRDAMQLAQHLVDRKVVTYQAGA
jgi:tRNA A-37 threonylcarbamoyl transferase component Bud32